MSETIPASPWTAGIKAVRDNVIPLVIILSAAAALVVSYYEVPSVKAALDRLGVVNREHPWLFAALCTGTAAGFIPWCFRMCLAHLRPRHPFWDLLHSVLWWGFMGVLVSWFYGLQASWFGSDASPRVVVAKVTVDMLGFTIFLGAPLNAISHLWKDSSWDTALMRSSMGPGWYRRLVLPNLLPNYCVWLPGTCIFYSMPTELQIVVANCIGCFWALMCARIATHQGVGDVSPAY